LRFTILRIEVDQQGRDNFFLDSVLGKQKKVENNMCGICGIINTKKNNHISQAMVGAMCDVITHRGPDEEGLFIESNIGLGMRRLKIIDLTTGSQPIFNEDKSIVVIFNGEIYNFLELKENLFKKGHKFYTQSDTEVIAHLYEDHGEEFLTHLNGMFAIALWDKKKQKLILARDRLGEKPLYYTKTNDALIFGSELKCILCYPKLVKELELKAIHYYFIFNYIPAPWTIYKNIFKLQPGQYLIYQDNVISIKKYWDAKFGDFNTLSEKDVQERLYHELCRAVKLRLISDVPLGAFLSGGIDSSIMVALMCQNSNTHIKTFSIGLENEKKSELPFARAVAEKYGCDHHELIARPDALKLIDQLLWHFDEPFGDSSALPSFLVSQLTKNYVTVAISGDGGDELFGGYERYQRILSRASINKIPTILRKPISKGIGEFLPFGFKGKAFLTSLQYDNYDFFTTGTSEQFKSLLFSNNFSEQLYGISTKEITNAVFLEHQPLLNQCMYFDMKLYLPDDILTKVDRMSMANSLETRAPFLDHHLVELSLSIPPDFKIKGNIKKYILKRVFRNLLPESIFTHQKTGFSIPLGDWFKRELKLLIMETLSKKRIEEIGILSYPFIEKIISQHMTGKRNYKRLIWMILIFQLWYETRFSEVHYKIKKALKHRGVI